MRALAQDGFAVVPDVLDAPAHHRSQNTVRKCGPDSYGTGDALPMRALLHASSPAARYRQVLHLEFAPARLLPAGLEWAEAA